MRQGRRRRSPRSKILRVSCILFDLDGTLYESPAYSKQLESEILCYVSGRLQLGEAETKALLNQRRRELGTLTSALQSLRIDRNAFFETMADRIEPSLYISKDCEVRETIRALRGRGFKIGLVSNSGRPLVVKILDAIGLESRLFDIIVTSTEAEPKPSPQPFLLAVNTIGCKTSEIAYVGDREAAEIRPAKRSGLKTILLQRDKGTATTCADSEVRRICELPRLVRLRSSPR